jgi:hypothetical protein
MDSRAVNVENQDNNAPVATPPYNAPVGNEEMQTAQSFTRDNENLMLRRHSEESIAVAIFKICKPLIFSWGCVTSVI